MSNQYRTQLASSIARDQDGKNWSIPTYRVPLRALSTFLGVPHRALAGLCVVGHVFVDGIGIGGGNGVRVWATEHYCESRGNRECANRGVVLVV